MTRADSSQVTYGYDANGNNTTSSDGRTIAYTAFDKPKSILKGTHTTAFAYGPDRSRFKRTDTDAQGTTTTLYLGSVEKIARPDLSTEVKRYIDGLVIESSGAAATGCTANETLYVLRDHLGSVARLTDAQGNEVQGMRFDPWGRRRNAVTGEDLTETAEMTFDTCATTRGFTGHEMLDDVGIVHMNGRIYDPGLGRFLQADPVVQFPNVLQNHNRYSYVMNNPLAYTDPSGNFIFSLTATFALAASGTTKVAIIAASLGAGTFADALVRGASFGDALLSGVSTFATTYVGGRLLPGKFGLNHPTFAYVATVSTVGGITGSLQGGRFGNAFKMAGLSSVLGGVVGTSKVAGALGGAGQLAAKAAIAGTLTELSGGKFANGALTAAFSAIVSDAFPRSRYTTGSAEIDRKLIDGLSDPDFTGADGYTYVANPEDFGLPNARIKGDDGFLGGLFVKGDKLVFVFGGTNPASLADWWTNVKQAFGFETSQYKQAAGYARDVAGHIGTGSLRFTGHSLGGGLASIAAHVTGHPATTYNAAGLHSNTIARYSSGSGLSNGASSIHAYHSSFDVLSILQRITPLPDAVGQRIPLGRAGVHGMGGVCRGTGGC